MMRLMLSVAFKLQEPCIARSQIQLEATRSSQNQFEAIICLRNTGRDNDVGVVPAFASL